MSLNLNINFYKNLILFIFILFNTIELTKENYIKIPFKVINENEQEVFNSLDDYFKSWYYISFYGQVSVGTPPKKVIAKLNFDDYGISILYKGCNYSNTSVDIDSSLNVKDASSSFHQITDFFFGNETFYYKSFYGAYYAEDHFYFDTINDKAKAEDLKFIYSPNDNKKESTCFNIGFKAFSRNLRETDLNIIKQLKNKNIINNYIYSIIYETNDTGFLLFGEYPHILNKENINLNWFHAVKNEKKQKWCINFDKISYSNSDLFQIQREGIISIENKFIISPYQYFNLIKDIFGK
jgi:hypothetical protein